jgi:hypothetical protein
MKLTVQNLGRLAEATIDLDKDLILFVGPNNTSKTYVAHTIYGFFSRVLPLFATVLLERLLARGAPGGEPTIQLDVGTVLDRLSESLEKLASLYRAELADVLAADDDFTVDTRVSFSIDPNVVERVRTSLREDYESAHDIEVPPDYRMRIRKILGDNYFQFDRIALTQNKGTAEGLNFGIAHFLSGCLSPLFHAHGATHILPAERAAIQLFSRELSIKRTQLVDEMLVLSARRRRGANEKLTEILQHNARRYPAGIRAYLELANDLANRRKTTSGFAPLADRLDEVLGGALHVSDDGDLRFQPGPETPKLDLHLASSSVKALAGLSFHLRHLLAKNDILIIDEPELNLHPDNQRRVARVLAQLARGGVKVILTTHSDYIVREINNLIMLSADESGELRQRHGYSAEETIKPTQVGAYRFDTTRAHPLEVTPTGIEVETIDREINALNTVSQDIYFSLFNKA